MDLNLLLIMAAAGLCAVSSHTVHHRQYHFFHEAKNMSEAQIYCREKYTDLATVDSMEDLTLLNKMSGKYSQSAWIGLYRDSWRWSLSDTDFYKPGETEFRGWWPGGPAHDVEKTCTMMWTYDRKWYDWYCPTLYKAACVDVKGPNATFVFSHSTMNWTDAQSYCRKDHTDLASVRNLEENQQLLDMVSVRGDAWIGLYRESWKWSDGSNSSLRYWAGAEPTGPKMCVAADFHNSGKWEGFDCGLKKPFICYKYIVPVTMQVIKVRLERTNSDVDPNDPTFQEEMLLKMKKVLRDKGLDDNIQLTWRKQPDGQVFQKEEKKRDEL